MNNIESWNEAQKRIAQLQKAIAEQQRQLKEIESHTVEFVDNPKNPINQKEVIGDTDIIYVPTEADRKHYPMKKEDLDRHFDNTHMPIYFTNEHSCMMFNSIFPVLKDMLKFKITFDDDGIIKPTVNNKLYYVYLDTEINEFVWGVSSNECVTTIYFSSDEVAKNCAIWLNYKYGLGNYSK